MAQDDLPAAAGADALTEALRACGVLAEGRVMGSSLIHEHKALVSRVLRLRLVYDRPSPEAPATIVLKTGFGRTMTTEWLGGRQEIAFYADVAPLLRRGVVPQYFGGHWDAGTGAWHLLLEDLTETHVIASEWPFPPGQGRCEQIVAAHARLHAAWWDHPRLGVSVGTWPDAKARSASWHRLQKQYEAMADRLGDALLPSHRALYERFLAAMPQLGARSRSHRNMTVVHGDAHVWNCFLPRDGSDDARLFDWDGWRPNVGAIDLAYMMAAHWFPDRREAMEVPLLDHYHQVVVAHGVGDYDRQMLTDDYRWSALIMLALPPVMAAMELPAGLWWNHLARITMAVDDLGCRELLG